MQIDAQEALPLLEKSGELVFFDIEASGLRGDYNSTLVASLKAYDQEPYSFVVEKPGHDKKLVTSIRDALEEYSTWVTYYGRGFDIPFLRTRLLRWGVRTLDTRHHIDLYYSLKSHLLTARKSQGHLLSFLETPEEKMSISPNVWNEVAADPIKNLEKLRLRCESDVTGLEALYKKTKHLIREIKK